MRLTRLRFATIASRSVLLSLVIALAACNQSDAPAPATPEAAAPATPTAPAATEATAGTPAAPAAGTTAAPAPAAAEPAPAATPDVPVGPAPVAGVDYVEIAGGQPFEPATGRIEVAEIFSYTCPHCASFEPMVVAWRARQPADVKFTPVAGPFAANPMPFAQAFYAAQTLGIDGRAHEALFRAVHIDRSVDYRDVTPEKLGAFYAQFGANAQQFANTMKSFAVDAKVKRATQWIMKSGVEGTPAIVVNGKYRVTGKTLEDTLRIATHLVAQERTARGG